MKEKEWTWAKWVGGWGVSFSIKNSFHFTLFACQGARYLCRYALIVLLLQIRLFDPVLFSSFARFVLCFSFVGSRGPKTVSPPAPLLKKMIFFPFCCSRQIVTSHTPLPLFLCLCIYFTLLNSVSNFLSFFLLFFKPFFVLNFVSPPI
jgi:hypothetical protein